MKKPILISAVMFLPLFTSPAGIDNTAVVKENINITQTIDNEDSIKKIIQAIDDEIDRTLKDITESKDKKDKDISELEEKTKKLKNEKTVLSDKLKKAEKIKYDTVYIIERRNILGIKSTDTVTNKKEDDEQN